MSPLSSVKNSRCSACDRESRQHLLLTSTEASDGLSLWGCGILQRRPGGLVFFLLVAKKPQILCCFLFILITKKPRPRMVHLQTRAWPVPVVQLERPCNLSLGQPRTYQDSHPTWSVFVKNLSAGWPGSGPLGTFVTLDKLLSSLPWFFTCTVGIVRAPISQDGHED